MTTAKNILVWEIALFQFLLAKSFREGRQRHGQEIQGVNHTNALVFKDHKFQPLRQDLGDLKKDRWDLKILIIFLDITIVSLIRYCRRNWES